MGDEQSEDDGEPGHDDRSKDREPPRVGEGDEDDQRHDGEYQDQESDEQHASPTLPRAALRCTVRSRCAERQQRGSPARWTSRSSRGWR